MTELAYTKNGIRRRGTVQSTSPLGVFVAYHSVDEKGLESTGVDLVLPHEALDLHAFYRARGDEKFYDEHGNELVL